MKALSEKDARQSLNAHAAEKGHEIFSKYGPRIGWEELVRLLQDRSCVRYPCQIVFDATKLQPGEFAYAANLGARPEDGFVIYVHGRFQDQLDKVPALVLYQLVTVNYGPFVSAEDAEVFGANALGLEQETYYQALCVMADEVSPVTS